MLVVVGLLDAVGMFHSRNLGCTNAFVLSDPMTRQVRTFSNRWFEIAQLGIHLRLDDDEGVNGISELGPN